MGAPVRQNEVTDLSRLWPGYAYYVSGRGTEKAMLRRVPTGRRINRVVIDRLTNDARNIYSTKPGWEPITTDAQLAEAVAHCEEMGRIRDERRALERARRVEVDAAARVTAQATVMAVREVMREALPPAASVQSPAASDEDADGTPRGRRR